MAASSCPHNSRFEITEVCRFCQHKLCPSCRITHHPKPKVDDAFATNTTVSKSRGSAVPFQREQYQCRPCTMKQEQIVLKFAILDAPLTKVMMSDSTTTYEANIADLIASYAVGYVVQCCNNKENCKTEISISNRFDLQKSPSSMDSDGGTILNVEYKHSPLTLAGEISNVDISSNAMNDPQAPRASVPRVGSSDHVFVYGDCRKIYCTQCNNPGPKKVTPYMMMMRTKRFKKNRMGRYSIQT